MFSLCLCLCFSPSLSISFFSHILSFVFCLFSFPPSFGKGANQAIQDAYCLSIELAKAAPGAGGGGDVLGKALKTYEQQRKPATTLLMLEVRVVVVVVVVVVVGRVHMPAIHAYPPLPPLPW